MRSCMKTKADRFLARVLAGLMITTTVAFGSLSHAVLNIQGAL